MSSVWDGDDDDEDDLYCQECDSELDPDGICQNELCAHYREEPVDGGPDDRWLRDQERKQMGIGS